jgi:hypothetical protein
VGAICAPAIARQSTVGHFEIRYIDSIDVPADERWLIRIFNDKWAFANKRVVKRV